MNRRQFLISSTSCGFSVLLGRLGSIANDATSSFAWQGESSGGAIWHAELSPTEMLDVATNYRDAVLRHKPIAY